LNPTLLILILAMGAVWVLFIRPQRRRQQLQREMLNRIEPGAEVLTAAGLYGTVIEAEGDEIKVEIAEGVVVKIARRAIGAVIPPELEEAEEPVEAEETEPEAPVAEATDDDAAAKPPS
jgi:preprotein translocase subunit YajC